MMGKHLIKHWSVTQSVVTLSSAESELNGICKGSSTGLGLLAIARDLGWHWTLEILTDASAAIGITRRRGLGRIRHLAVADLWVQDRARSGDLTIKKIPGAENPADLLTKHMPRPLMLQHLKTLNLRFDEGRASLAPEIDHL